MKNIFYKTLAIITITTFGSCDNSDEPTIIKEDDITIESDTINVHAIYKHKDFYSEAISRNDSLIYLDPEFNILMTTIGNIPESVSFVRSDGTVMYFDSQDDFQKRLGLRIVSAEELKNHLPINHLNMTFEQTRASADEKLQAAYNQMETTDIAFASLFDDDTWSDRNLPLHIKNLYDSFDYSHLGNFSLNDKITSLVVRYNLTNPELCAILTIWEDSDFNFGDNDRTKHRTNFVANLSSPNINCKTLKNIPCFNSGDSWNDRISSISFHIGYSANLPLGY